MVFIGGVWEWLSTGILVSVSSALSPEWQTAVSSYTTIVCSAFPLPDPRVSSWKWDWPFKRAFVSLTDYCLSPVDTIPTDFSQPDVMWALLHSSGALDWGAQLGVEIPFFSGGSFAAEISLWNLSHCPWEWGQPLSSLCPSYQSWCGFCISLDIRLFFR